MTTTDTPVTSRTESLVEIPDDDLVAEPISLSLGRFVADLAHDDVPPEVRERARLLLLDSLGIALASTTYDFATDAAAAVAELADGGSPQASVIGRAERWPVRDAVLLNGLLVHGLDFDDTHPEGVVHASASAATTALGIAEQRGLSGRDLLTAYVVGLEAAARIGSAARGAFHQVGFHPTGVVGAYATALVAGRLRGLDANGLARAQGFVHSLASGSLEFLESGAWTKRIHPGWAGVAGITAVSFAAADFVSPALPYEGRFGLFASHLGGQPFDVERCRAGLRETWETTSIAVKPFPACHFTHAFADAAIGLRDRFDLRPEDVASVRCLIAQGEVSTVCEPAAAKQRPQSSYEAQFSLPYVTAAALVRGRFTLAELEESAWTDPAILALVDRMSYEADPGSDFPDHFSGEVVLTTTDGRELRHREQVNRGAGDRPLSTDDVVAKFRANAALALREPAVEAIERCVLDLEACEDAGELGALLRTD